MGSAILLAVLLAIPLGLIRRCEPQPLGRQAD